MKLVDDSGICDRAVALAFGKAKRLLADGKDVAFFNLLCEMVGQIRPFMEKEWEVKPNPPWHTGTPTESGNYLVFYWDDHNPMCMDIPHLFNGILGFNAESSEWIDEDGMVAFDNEEICLWQKIDMPSDEFLASLRG